MSGFEKIAEVQTPERTRPEGPAFDLLKGLEDGEIKLAEGVEYASTYGERFDQTPVEGERGRWTGERGESMYIPANEGLKDLLSKKGDVEGIVYNDAIPDFSPVSEAAVEIENMTDKRFGRDGNFEQCDEKCAGQWNEENRNGKTDWNGRDVADWRRENGYTWHERNDMRTCELVPSSVNAYFGHFGGVGEYNRNNGKDGGFDE